MANHSAQHGADIVAFPTHLIRGAGKRGANRTASITQLGPRLSPVVDVDCWYHQDAIQEQAAPRTQ